MSRGFRPKDEADEPYTGAMDDTSSGEAISGAIATHPKPSLRSFLRGRLFSSNGVAAAFFLAVSVWIARNPERAARIWRQLQGRS